MIYTESSGWILFVRRAEAMTTDAGTSTEQPFMTFWRNCSLMTAIPKPMHCGIWITKHQVLHQKHRKWWKYYASTCWTCRSSTRTLTLCTRQPQVSSLFRTFSSTLRLCNSWLIGQQEIRQTSGHVQCGDWGRVLLLSTCWRSCKLQESNFGDRESPGDWMRLWQCLIRTRCKAFAAGVVEKNGGHFIVFVKAFLLQHQLHSLLIVPFRGLRFNIVFDNAAGVFFLHLRKGVVYRL